MPVFNEEKYIQKTLTALTKQTLKPTQIIVADDGSTDASPDIASMFSGVQILRLPKEKKAMIERVPAVLNAGSRLLKEFDYLAILDADTILEPGYYEKLVAKLQTDKKKVGIACGKLAGRAQTGLMLGLIPYVYGCNRLYTRDCWLRINSGDKIMKPVPVWDFYHTIYAEMLGFTTKRYDDIRSWALRPPGYRKAFFNGYISYQVGYYGYFLFLRAARNRKPSLLAGYLKAKFSDATQYPIKPYVRYLQNQRIGNLVKKIFR
jgi:glycosyltransferase involved in cell wall biosynthesis